MKITSFARVASAAATFALVVCAVTVTTLLVRREMASGAVGNRASAPVAQPDWMDYAGAGHRIGSLNARVTVIEFFDYQCPFCKKMDARLQSALAKYSGDLAVVYRHWPLKRIHPFAMAAAVASECAAASGRFERMHALLLNQQDSLGVLSWRELGRVQACRISTRIPGACPTRPRRMQSRAILRPLSALERVVRRYC